MEGTYASGIDSDFKFEHTPLEGVFLITPFARYDNRGCFIKDFNDKVFSDNGIEYTILEVFYSFSVKNTVRGLHFQREKQMPKLVRCLHGSIFDVAVDLRADSPSFANSFSIELSEYNNKALLVPKGCAHGFFTLSDALVSYKCAERFIPETDDGIRWDDPDLGICWPVTDDTEIVISDKDAGLQSFNDFIRKFGSL